MANQGDETQTKERVRVAPSESNAAVTAAHPSPHVPASRAKKPMADVVGVKMEEIADFDEISRQHEEQDVWSQQEEESDVMGSGNLVEKMGQRAETGTMKEQADVMAGGKLVENMCHRAEIDDMKDEVELKERLYLLSQKMQDLLRRMKQCMGREGRSKISILIIIVLVIPCLPYAAEAFQRLTLAKVLQKLSAHERQELELQVHQIQEGHAEEPQYRRALWSMVIFMGGLLGLAQLGPLESTVLLISLTFAVILSARRRRV